jgi:uncharacterized phage protein (TIGR01671 family)
MREIKFRAWDKLREEMIYQLTGSVTGLYYFFETKLVSADYLDDAFDLMQYTGFKDKNEKEIYEGDIVKVSSVNYPVMKPFFRIVTWDDRPHYHGFMLQQNGEVKEALGRIMKDINSKWRIIIKGNIYENPELIK